MKSLKALLLEPLHLKLLAKDVLEKLFSKAICSMTLLLVYPTSAKSFLEKSKGQDGSHTSCPVPTCTALFSLYVLTPLHHPVILQASL